jgi:hypothetical protein
VKKYSQALLVFSVSLIVFFSCTKINESTTLGGDLIPEVDNITTFEAILPTNTVNRLLDDTARVAYSDNVALGDISGDPEFGNVHANFAFRLSALSYGIYPFQPKKDTVHTIDSVVLTLQYAGAYGDTASNGIQTVSVYEIPQSANFRSDTSYRFNDPASDFTGSLIGTKTYAINKLKDTSYVKEPGDTGSRFTKYVNVLRIPLNNSFGAKIANFDSDLSKPNPGFYNDSAFRKELAGLAVRASNSGNALAYFNLMSSSNTKLTIYYRIQKVGATNDDTTLSVDFVHSGFGQANYVNVQPGGNWQAAINNPNADRLFIQSSPSGAYAEIDIPDLDNFQNAVVHRAELIANRLSPVTPFNPPPRLYLDRVRKSATTSTFTFENDLPLNQDGSIGFDIFGGTSRGDGTYRFNITRYVQGIITRNEPNDTLRLFAPYRTVDSAINIGTRITIPVNSNIANGRVILAGGNYIANPAVRMRLRIIYSKL